MRTLFFSLLAAVIFASCGNDKKVEKTQRDIVRENIEAYFKPQLKDTSSYQFAKLDTVILYYVADSITQRVSVDRIMDKKPLSDYDQFLDRLVIWKGYPSEIKKLIQERYQDSLHNLAVDQKMDSTLAAITEIQKKTPWQYFTAFSFRAKNSYGALDLYNYYVYLDTSLQVTEVKDQKKYK